MRKLPRISDAEWDVMQVVWGKSPITAAGVVRELAPRTGWNHRTIRTMLNRLARKGALTFKVEGNRHLYSAMVERNQCVREETRSFLRRVFSDDAASLLLHCVEQCDLSKSDVEELRRLLEQKVKRTGEVR